MKNFILALFLIVTSPIGSYAQAPVTFTLVTPPCDSNGVLVAHYTASSFPLTIQWLGGTGAAGMTTTHTTSILNDTLYNYNGGPLYVQVYGTSGPNLDTGGYAGHPSLTFSFSSSPAVSGMGTASVTVTGGTPPYSYQWYTGPCPPPYGGSLVGTTDPISLPPGIYGVEVTDAGGCWYSSCIGASGYDTIKSLPSGVDMQFQKNSSASIYPNPATTSLTITSPTQITTLSVTNLIGQVVFTDHYNTGQVHIDVADLPKGLYFVKVNDTEVRKFVKE